MKILITIIFISLYTIMAKGQFYSQSPSLVGGFRLGQGKFLDEKISSNHETLYSVYFEMGLRFKAINHKKNPPIHRYIKNDFSIFYEYTFSNPLDFISSGLNYKIYFSEIYNPKFYMAMNFGTRVGYTYFSEFFEKENFSNYHGLITGINFGFVFFEPLSLIVGFNYDQYFCFDPDENSILKDEENFGKLSLGITFLVNIN